MRKVWMKRLGYGTAVAAIIGGIVLSLPVLLAISIEQERSESRARFDQFPVTVNPREKSIVESDQVNEFLESPDSPLLASVGTAGSTLVSGMAWIAAVLSDLPWYQSLAAVATGDRYVIITPGMRKEQVASAFGKALAWTASERKQFLLKSPEASLPLAEGSFAPGVYAVPPGTTPALAQSMVNERFSADVLSRYGTTTASLVPLEHALIVASLIQREAGGPDDMRFISGIIWNRLFANMNLQIDATVQYAKANRPASASWWPKVLPRDTSINSPFNTYRRSGLPPSPIANPSVAAILAALNPKQTSCLFYFHDADREFHCSDSYTQHVALLKQFYGRGK